MQSSKPSKLKVLSLFSGAGGMDLGFEGGFPVFAKSVTNPEWIDLDIGQDQVLLKPTMFETVFACDIRPSAKIVWENHFKRPQTFHLESIVDLVRKHQAGLFKFPDDISVVTGGFPCQDFSLAGKRRGFDSHKSHTNVVDSNIPSIESRGMLYYWMREVINIVKPKVFVAENVKGLVSLGDVKDIIADDFRAIGYHVLDPQVLHAGEFGVPQSRERVIFIGIRQDLIVDQAASSNLNLYPIPTHNLKSQIVTSKDVLGDLPDPENSSDLSHQAYSKAKWMGKHCQGQIEVKWEGLAPTIRSEHHGNIEFRRLSQDHGGKLSSEFNKPERRLSVRECARIQTFPDTFDFVVNAPSGKVSGSEAYKLVGNAVPPLLAYHIAKQIEKFLMHK